MKLSTEVKLILADVDETIADVYTDATPEMISELNKILSKGTALFLVSGGGLQSIRERVTDKLDKDLRHRVLVAHCTGAEVWGFELNGELKKDPFYGVYDEKMSVSQKKRWREIIDSIILKYKLVTYPTMPTKKFIELTNGNRNSIMLADRGPQITLEFPNSEDMRPPILEDLKTIYIQENFPVHPKLAGMFALDNPLDGVDKTFAIDTILNNKEIIGNLNLPLDIRNKSDLVEIWGDKFAEVGGSDFMMSKAVSPKVKSVDFREESEEKFADGYNIMVWRGKKHLHEGLLEYLQGSI